MDDRDKGWLEDGVNRVLHDGEGAVKNATAPEAVGEVEGVWVDAIDDVEPYEEKEEVENDEDNEKYVAGLDYWGATAGSAAGVGLRDTNGWALHPANANVKRAGTSWKKKRFGW